MKLRRVLTGVSVAVVLALAGCGPFGGDDDAAAPKADAPKAAAADGVTADNAPISATALCEFLKKEQPRIEAVGSEVGAQAQLTIGISNLYNGHEDKLDGYVIDEQAEKTCPETRTALLKAAGIKTFGNL